MEIINRSAFEIVTRAIEAAGAAGGAAEVQAIAAKGPGAMAFSEKDMKVLIEAFGSPGESMHEIQLEAQRQVSLAAEHDFGHGPVPAHQHQNGYGWVADTASVASTAFVGPHATVAGHAVVGGDAKVMGRATVTDDARVTGNAVVAGKAVVAGHARVTGDATVEGDAVVSGHATVQGDAVVKSGALSQ